VFTNAGSMNTHTHTHTNTHNDYLNKTNSSPQNSAFLAAPWYKFEGESPVNWPEKLALFADIAVSKNPGRMWIPILIQHQHHKVKKKTAQKEQQSKPGPINKIK